MNSPRFNAEASLYRSRLQYANIGSWTAAFKVSGRTSTLPRLSSLLRSGGGGSDGGGGVCTPKCGACLAADPNESSTGCVKQCTKSDCSDYTVECTGCCPGGTFCSGVCTHTQTDPQNCGSCGKICTAPADASAQCIAGTCSAVCDDSSLGICNGKCVDLTGDALNCGKCGNVCPSEMACVSGVCKSCDYAAIAGCINLAQQGYNACVSANGCVSLPNAQQRAACLAACRNENSEQACKSQGCRTGRSCCPGGACKLLATDTQNCGACGNVCYLPPEHATSTTCLKGICDFVCESGFTKCGDECTDTMTDPKNCGQCGNTCPTNGGYCSNGQCVCQSPLNKCGEDPHAVCVDFANDPNNCGACGKPCPTNEICSNGTCVCRAPFTLCGGDCVDLTSSLTNCGVCGFQCVPGLHSHCVSSQCVCDQGYYPCAGKGCVDLSSDHANCGRCGNGCVGNASCIAGECICPGTWQLCPGDTLCTDVHAMDDHNCGACGRTCTGSGEKCCWGVCCHLGAQCSGDPNYPCQ